MEENSKKESHSEKKEAQSSKFKLKKSDMWKYTTILFIVLLIFSVAMNARGAGIGAEKAADQAINYINDNLLQPGSTATLNSVEEINDVYEINMSIGGKEYLSYISLDGKMLFTNGIDMSVEIPQEEAVTAPETSTLNLTKVAKPKMTVWIESRCPFGVQAANGITRVYDILKGKADLEVRYMVTDNNGEIVAMHGAEELAEDRRHICVREEQGYDVFMKYLRCYAETGATTECESKSGVDSAKLSKCVTEKSTEYLKKDASDWRTIYVPKGGSGSPSFFLNDFKINEYEKTQNGRAPENLKSIICNNMITLADSCSSALPTNNPPRGFGIIESGATTGDSAASC